MIRVFITFILLAFIVLGNVGGCGGGGGGGNPQGRCLLLLGGEVFSEDYCASAAQAFNCESFNFEDFSVPPDPPGTSGTCQLNFCDDCLCNNVDLTFQNVSDLECDQAYVDNRCIGVESYEFGQGLCELTNCLQDLPCGPF